MSATEIHISLSAEPIAHIGNLVITNSMLTSLVVSGLIIGFAFLVNQSLKKTNKPTGMQNFGEWVVESLFNLVYGVTGDLKKARLFFPIISTFFIFILLNNWFGLLPGVGTLLTPLDQTGEEVVETNTAATTPEETEQQTTETLTQGNETIYEIVEAGKIMDQIVTEETEAAYPTESHQELVPLFRAGTADLNTTLALGIISVIMIQLFGIQASKLGYFSKFFNFSSPLMFFVGILEIVSEFSKIISFAFRLFGNIFAGEVLLVVITSLVGIIGPIPFYGLEVFVGFIQALVFAMLSLVLMNMATIGHNEH